MRNYFKMMGLWVHFHDGADQGELIVWGGTDEQLQFYSAPIVLALKEQNPDYVFDYHPPQVCWFELNQENFAKLLNGPNGEFAYRIWNNTHLNPGGTSPVANIGDYFYEMTRVEVEGSPRASWSHGH